MRTALESADDMAKDGITHALVYDEPQGYRWAFYDETGAEIQGGYSGACFLLYMRALKKHGGAPE